MSTTKANEATHEHWFGRKNWHSIILNPKCHQQNLLEFMCDILHFTHLDVMKLSYFLSLFSGVLAVGLCSIIIYAGNYLADLSIWAIVLAVVCFFLMLLTLLIIGRQPTSSVKLSFKVRHPSAFRISMYESLKLLTFLSVLHCVWVCVQRYRDGLELKWGFTTVWQ